MLASRVFQILERANLEAQNLACGCVEPEHILLALVLEDGEDIFNALGTTKDALQQVLPPRTNPGVIRFSRGIVPLSLDSQRIIAAAHTEANKWGFHCTAIEHLLWALFQTGGSITETIKSVGITLEKIKAYMERPEVAESVISQKGLNH